MIETKNEVSKNLEKALQELQRAKQHVANEKKKQNKKKRKAEKPKSRGNAITPFIGEGVSRPCICRSDKLQQSQP